MNSKTLCFCIILFSFVCRIESENQVEKGRIESVLSSNSNEQLNLNTTSDCVLSSINDFPSDLFTQKQRRFGAIIFHIIFGIYLFKSILIVINEYFMCSIELIGQRFNLDQDVLGATFMAVGSSTPGVLISLITIFFSESEPGIGSSVGSAIFNILFIVGICGLFITNSAKLSTWPFLRDSFFYTISILFLFILIKDDRVYWYESMCLVILYALYCVFMMNNDRIKNWAYQKFEILQQETNNILPGPTVPHNKNFVFNKRPLSRSQSGYSRFNDEDDMYAWGGTLNNINDHVQNVENYSYQNSYMVNQTDYDIRNVDSLIASSTRQIDFDTSVIQMMTKRRYFRPRTTFKMAVRRIIDEQIWLKKSSIPQNVASFPNLNMNPFNKENYLFILSTKPDAQNGIKSLIIWASFVPIRTIFYFTIPDCRTEKYKKNYFLTFVLSVSWLSVLSYLIIWMIRILGYTIGIPDPIMEITLIAAGTSISDAYTSIIVVRQGMVDMGVSNIIGSNVFDLLIGLALPWIIKSFFNNGYIVINSAGIGYDSLILFVCVLSTVMIIHFRKWYLDYRAGYVFLSVYAAFIIFSAAIELNVFAYVNPPVCI
ncbi:unnamed protein product [Brachionus calyciflorus]|uniref:Sodium/calcium exchanger membrane region domain-containing protein n=1 Tax=Brachionus calyciflorus TaxID=104777 RepID=A0A814HVD0_9BILA|nr:unnamed protein product [Brachionus calyciflorus]